MGGNCNTLMIANIWGVKEHIEETISTLRFGTRMMCVSNTPVVNVQYDPMVYICYNNFLIFFFIFYFFFFFFKIYIIEVI